MGNMLELAATNLTSPIVLFFGLCLLITLVKARVEFLGAVSDFITIYLLTAIGFKGGAAIAEAGMSSIFLTILGAVFLGLIECDRESLDNILFNLTGSRMVSLHTDVSTKTGERIFVFKMNRALD